MKKIEVHNLSISYGTLRAVDNFSFSVEDGEILTLAGPDGAGKTSIFRAVCNLINYDSGDIVISGYNLAGQFDKIKTLLGYMPQSFSLYPDLSVEENLSFYAGLFAMDKKKIEKTRNRLYEFSGLGPFAKRRAEALSGGMKQKLALACNLIHDPEVLILDEPTTGVDPLSRRQFWDILKALKDSGSAIVVSTPYMDEVALSDRAIFIHAGRRLAEGTPEELLGLFKGKVYSIQALPSSETMNKLEQIEGASFRRFGSSLHLYIDGQDSIDRLGKELGPLGIDEVMIRPTRPELEDVFIQLMKD
jgi:ABC-2 type transport system ATP-binding protein